MFLRFLAAQGAGFWVRWLLLPLLPPTLAYSAWLGAWYVIDRTARHCGSDGMTAGLCVEPWHTNVIDAAIYTEVAVVAIGCVVLGAWLAPRASRSIAIIMALVVALPPTALSFMSGWPELVRLAMFAWLSAAAAAAAVWWFVTRRSSR